MKARPKVCSAWKMSWGRHRIRRSSAVVGPPGCTASRGTASRRRGGRRPAGTCAGASSRRYAARRRTRGGAASRRSTSTKTCRLPAASPAPRRSGRGREGSPRSACAPRRRSPAACGEGLPVVLLHGAPPATTAHPYRSTDSALARASGTSPLGALGSRTVTQATHVLGCTRRSRPRPPASPSLLSSVVRPATPKRSSRPGAPVAGRGRELTNGSARSGGRSRG